MAAPARKMRGAAALLSLALVACGVKGPPRAPGASTPPAAFETQPCDDCLLQQPQPGLLEGDPPFPDRVDEGVLAPDAAGPRPEIETETEPLPAP